VSWERKLWLDVCAVVMRASVHAPEDGRNAEPMGRLLSPTEVTLGARAANGVALGAGTAKVEAAATHESS
jgi:hypothetical protein